MSRLIVPALAALTASLGAAAAQTDCAEPLALCAEGDGFALIEGGVPAPVLTDEDEFEGVLLAASNLAADLAAIAVGAGDGEPLPVIAGTIGRSATIDAMIARGLLDASEIEGAWEGFVQAVVEDPAPGVPAALVVAGSDQRGTIFGLYDLAERAGMSPWHYWADVAPDRHTDLYVTAGVRTDAPAVRYRGIFLNDEEPALGGYVRRTHGDFNADFYERVFDLILRLKGNFLWPAMWGKAFYDDDPENGALAQRMGIVMGTSHHEPLTRAHVEWGRHGEGAWNYETNPERLQAFWRGGMERLGEGEALVTVGMRGDGDEAMTEGTAIELLERIVADQRAIIEETTGAPAAETPQVWALYKEVQDYYDQGMEVPDDVTLLFADDNWGNIRRLPRLGTERPGGYGVYYHFDYVGGPRNHKWLNTTQVERVYEQMDLAWEAGARRLWVVNVGDLKPMELPIDFFLEQAWDPDAMTAETVDTYAADFAAQAFGAENAEAVGALLEAYTKYNSRRKPELLDASSFDAATGEWGRVADAYARLADRADDLRGQMPEGSDEAYVQLVWFPIQAMANLYDLYRSVALNRLYAEADDPRANEMANRAEAAYARDAELTAIYHGLKDGKWDSMMSQTHIGYTIWQQPDEQTMPEVARVGDDAAGRAERASPPLVAAYAAAGACLAPGGGASWEVVPNLGLTGDAVRLATPAREPFALRDGPTLTVPFDADEAGPVTVELVLSPSLDVAGGDGLTIAMGIGEGEPQTVSLDAAPDNPLWTDAVIRNSFHVRRVLDAQAGRNELTIHAIDPQIVIQRVHVAEGRMDAPQDRALDGTTLGPRAQPVADCG